MLGISEVRWNESINSGHMPPEALGNPHYLNNSTFALYLKPFPRFERPNDTCVLEGKPEVASIDAH